MKDPAFALAGFLVSLRYEDLPAEVVELVAMDIMDYFGNALGGSGDPAVAAAAGVTASFGSFPQCTVLAHDMRISPVSAALLNGVMGFALDFDDTHEGANTHLGVACIPAALAVSEICGKVSGKTFITAVAGAMEIGARLGLACKRKIPGHVMGGWDYAALHGAFTAAAAASKLLGLGEAAAINAFGIAYQLCSGNTLSAIEEADSKKLGPGFAAGGGVMAALLASAGLTGARSVFCESKFSLFNLYHDGGSAEKCVEDLGERFMLTELGFKVYPCCRLGHRHLDAILELMEECVITPDEVEEVKMTVCSQVNLQLCEPRERKTAPAGRSAAQFSLPWAAACAVARGRVGVGEFLPEALSDPALRETAGRMVTVTDASLANEAAPAQVEIRTSRGTFRRVTREPVGSPANPVSRAALEKKFLDNVQYCRKYIPQQKLDKCIHLLARLSEQEDMGALLRLLS